MKDHRLSSHIVTAAVPENSEAKCCKQLKWVRKKEQSGFMNMSRVL